MFVREKRDRDIEKERDSEREAGEREIERTKNKCSDRHIEVKLPALSGIMTDRPTDRRTTDRVIGSFTSNKKSTKRGNDPNKINSMEAKTCNVSLSK